MPNSRHQDKGPVGRVYRFGAGWALRVGAFGLTGFALTGVGGAGIKSAVRACSSIG